MAEIKYTIKLPPVSKKNSQQIVWPKGLSHPKVIPSKPYLKYLRDADAFLYPRPSRPIECSLNVKCLFFLPTRRQTDLTNLLEAVDDVLVHYKIIKDDNYKIVTAHDGSRCYHDKDNPRTEIIITRIEAEENPQMRIF